MSPDPSPSPITRRWREPRTRWLPAHQKRAGLGDWAANRSHAARARIKRWKRCARARSAVSPFDPAELAECSAAVAELVRAWSPVLPPGTLLTVPSQGASAPGPYAAESLGQAMPRALGLPFVEVLIDSKSTASGRVTRRASSDPACILRVFVLT
jgi:hypothetical protein